MQMHHHINTLLHGFIDPAIKCKNIKNNTLELHHRQCIRDVLNIRFGALAFHNRVLLVNMIHYRWVRNAAPPPPPPPNFFFF